MAWVPDQGISGAAGVNVRNPALKDCGESASTMLTGSLFQSPIVSDAKQYLYELVLAPLVLNLCLSFARVCPSACSSPISSGGHSNMALNNLKQKSQSEFPAAVLEIFQAQLLQHLSDTWGVKQAAIRCIVSSIWVSEKMMVLDRGCVLHYGANKFNICHFVEGAGQRRELRCRKLKVELAQLKTELIWGDQDKSFETRMPRYLASEAGWMDACLVPVF